MEKVQLIINGKPSRFTCDREMLELAKIYISEGRHLLDIVREFTASGFERILAMAIVANASRQINSRE